MPTCPPRLKAIIDLVNLIPATLELSAETYESREKLRRIAQAFFQKRQGKGTFPLVQLESPTEIRLYLDDGTFRVAKGSFILALEEIDPPEEISRIRECRVCSTLFWANDIRKETCDEKCSAAWTKRQQRGRQGKAPKPKTKKTLLARQ